MDCDEVFNYWEPLHYLLFGSGLQTWEYSPQFALRTYAYVGAHGVPAWAAQWLQLGISKPVLYLATRCVLGALSAAAEASLCRAVAARLGQRASLLTLLFLASNAGMFHAAGAFLPSSTCMILTAAAYSAWLRERVLLALALGSAAVLLCWPFCALMFVPMGLDALLKRGVLPVVGVAIACAMGFLGAPFALDSWMYGKPTLAIGNLVMYNALGQGGGGEGANLYGTEPWHFYLQNLALNFNLLMPCFLLSPLLVASCWNGFGPSSSSSSAIKSATACKPMPKREVLGLLAGAFASLALFTSMAHKEERFLSILYPVLCLGAAIFVDLSWNLLDRAVLPALRLPRALANLLVALALLASTGLSLSRSAALHVNFFAPVQVFQHLHDLAEQEGPVASVCVGKEWYRFPSSFFLPGEARVLWLESAFRGLLPQPYSSWPEGLSAVHAHFNDQNRHEAAAYAASSAACQFAVDLAVGEDYGTLGRWTDGDGAQWERVFCQPFMDASRSPALVRSFFVPFGVSRRSNTYADYCLLRNLQYRGKDGNMV